MQRDTADFRDVPAIAVCAVCGDPGCAGHDTEGSGEHPLRTTLSWEDPQTGRLRALWSTSLETTADLELWIRASIISDLGPLPALSFAILCETLAVAAVYIPVSAVASALAWRLTHETAVVLKILELSLRLSTVFIPSMVMVHVMHQVFLARAGGRLGRPVRLAASVRAGLYACGWDLATGPAGIVSALLSRDGALAVYRARGSWRIFQRATALWLDVVHGLDEASADRARKYVMPFAVLYLVPIAAMVGWAVLATLR